MTQAVWLCQCLCPSRHCILASAGEADTEADARVLIRAPMRRKVVELLVSGILNPWCALCGANRATWRYEVGRTRFATLGDATAMLERLERENIATNAIFGDIHRTERPN